MWLEKWWEKDNEMTRYGGRTRVGHAVGMGWLLVSYNKAKSTLHLKYLIQEILFLGNDFLPNMIKI